MNNTELENSIRDEAARVIAEIRKKEALDIKKLDDDFAAEMDELKKQAEAQTRARLDQEISRLENRALLERRKLELSGVEHFIESIVDEAMREIRHHPLYKKFLLDAVSGIAKKTTGHIEIRLNKEDLFLEEEIMAVAGTAGKNNGVTVAEDPGIKWGGCLVIERAKGLIFNSTVERIYFRKSLQIRQKVMEILKGNSE